MVQKLKIIAIIKITATGLMSDLVSQTNVRFLPDKNIQTPHSKLMSTRLYLSAQIMSVEVYRYRYQKESLKILQSSDVFPE